MDLIPDDSRYGTQRNDAAAGDPRLETPRPRHRHGDRRGPDRVPDDAPEAADGAAERRFARTMQRLGFSPSLVTPRLAPVPAPRPRRLPGDPAAGDWRPL